MKYEVLLPQSSMFVYIQKTHSVTVPQYTVIEKVKSEKWEI